MVEMWNRRMELEVFNAITGCFRNTHDFFKGRIDQVPAFGAVSKDVALKRLAWRIPLRPLWFFLYSYVWRRGFLDGREGFMFCYMRAVYEATINIKRFDLKRR